MINNVQVKVTQPNLSSKRNTWIFQANPNKYHIEKSLRNESEELWNLNQHAKKVKVGDRVLIWLSGKKAGIYGIGTIASKPTKQADSVKGMSYWINKKQGQRKVPRVLVKYEEVFYDNPLLKIYLEYDPKLWNLQIIRFAVGTNFPVSEDEWLAIKEWLDKKGRVNP